MVAFRVLAHTWLRKVDVHIIFFPGFAMLFIALVLQLLCSLIRVFTVLSRIRCGSIANFIPIKLPVRIVRHDNRLAVAVRLIRFLKSKN
jgi:hypothetical protein